MVERWSHIALGIAWDHGGICQRGHGYSLQASREYITQIEKYPQLSANNLLHQKEFTKSLLQFRPVYRGAISQMHTSSLQEHSTKQIQAVLAMTS